MFDKGAEEFLWNCGHGTRQLCSWEIEYISSGIPGGEVWILINVGLCVISQLVNAVSLYWTMKTRQAVWKIGEEESKRPTQSQTLNSFCDCTNTIEMSQIWCWITEKTKQRNSTALLFPWTTWQEQMKQTKAQSQPPQGKWRVCHGSHLRTYVFLVSLPAQTKQDGLLCPGSWA